MSHELILFSYRWQVLLWLAFTWLIPGSIIIVPNFTWEDKVLGYNFEYGNCLTKTSHPHILLYRGLQFLVAFLLPFVIIVASIAVIITSLKKHTNDLLGNTTAPKNIAKEEIQSTTSSMTMTVTSVSDSTSSVSVSAPSSVSVSAPSTLSVAIIEDNTTKLRLQRRQVQITKTLMVVVCVFFACIAPYTCSLLIPNTKPLMPYFSLLVFFNSCVNPLIYAKHPNFKEIFMYIFRGKWSDIPEKTTFLEFMSG